MRLLFVSSALALTVLVPLACSSFESSESGDAGTVGEVDGGSDGGGGGADGATDAGARATKLYLFGGVTVDSGNAEGVLEAHVASILDDGSLGPWERAQELDVLRYYMTTIEVPGRLLVMAGGRGSAIGQGTAGYAPLRDDVATIGDNPLEGWKGAPALGTANRRRAAAGAFMGGRVYFAGGEGPGDAPTSEVMAATVDGSPPTVQPWKPVGALPRPMANHRLVALGSRLYVLGGTVIGDGGFAATSSTSMTTLGAGETLADWESAGALPKPISAPGVVTDGTRVFLLGGEDGAGTWFDSVYVGSQTGTQQLSWQQTTPLTQARSQLCAVIANGRLYALGGNYATFTTTVEVGTVNGASITWKPTTPLPVGVWAAGCMAR